MSFVEILSDVHRLLRRSGHPFQADPAARIPEHFRQTGDPLVLATGDLWGRMRSVVDCLIIPEEGTAGSEAELSDEKPFRQHLFGLASVLRSEGFYDLLMLDRRRELGKRHP